MSLQKALQKAKAEFPIGRSVTWEGKFYTGFQSGIGKVIGYNSSQGSTGFVRAIVETHKGLKEFIIADPENDKYTPVGIELI